MLNTLFLTLTLKKLYSLQNRQLTCKTRTETMTYAPGINSNRVAQNTNLTYFAVGFSVMSLMINKPMLEILLESMQQNELQLECLSHWQFESVAAEIMSRNTWDFKHKNLAPQPGQNR